MPYEQNAGQNHKVKILCKSFENVAKFKHLRTTLGDRNCVREEIKSR